MFCYHYNTIGIHGRYSQDNFFQLCGWNWVNYNLKLIKFLQGNLSAQVVREHSEMQNFSILKPKMGLVTEFARFL